MNAAGTCKLLDAGEGEIDVRKLARSPVAAIMVGSITLEPREGNSGDVYYTEPGFSLNSLGLPNPGAAYYEKFLPEMAEIAHAAGKPLFVSVAGFSPEEYSELACLAFRGGADAVELNLGCPNVWEERRQKAPACFNRKLVEEILYQVRGEVGLGALVGVKVSPFSDVEGLERVVNILKQSELVKFTTIGNTFPNAYACDEEGKPRITPGGGLAAMGGPAIKPISLGQVKQLRALLPERIAIIGTGGIGSARDVLDYQNCGAQAVQIATAILNRGIGLFADILTELVDMAEVV